jgi:hypothetical protein
MITHTAKLLSQITDEGLFERLATAVLREADPRYASLVHPGVNAEGKTVKSPLDGITYIPGAQPAHMVAVHHTTTKVENLSSKWLHDPATVKPRKGGKPTAPPGDFVKAAKDVADERARSPALEATLVLTTNQEPSIETVHDLNEAASKQAIVIDLWPRSRLAHFLDKPEGQWIRHSFFGIEPEYLSPELLARLSRDSAQNTRPIDDQSDAWIDRSLDQSLRVADGDVVFVVAESGSGKSVACYKRLTRHIADGGFGIIVSHQTMEGAPSLDHAIDAALRQLHPPLAPNAGQAARSLCGSRRPFLVVIEDVNRSDRGAQLLEKLASWSAPEDAQTNKHDTKPPRTVQVLCPLWPEMVYALKDQTRKRVEQLSITCLPLTTEEARQAVQRRASLRSCRFSDMEADAVANALGGDPLLIALHDPTGTPDPQRVVDAFIDASVARAASLHPEFSAPDYRTALLELAQRMLVQRELEPTWSDVVGWFGLSGGIADVLRRLLDHGEIIRLASNEPGGRLRFRHDRVKDSLLSAAISAMMRAGTLDEASLSDPFFAEVIGAALASPEMAASFIDAARHANPLSLFYALRRAARQSNPHYSTIVKALNTWLDSAKTHDRAHQHLRWQALWVLSQTESPDVVALTKRFRESGWSAWFARLRNGDVSGGIELCQVMEPGASASWRDSQIEHAKLRYGKNLIAKVGEIMESPTLASAARVGTLRLAGHLADAALAKSIFASWEGDADRASHLEDYLWAGAMCCGDDPAKLLAPVCDAWAALPSKTDDKGPSPRDDLAAHNVRFAFSRIPPVHAMKYLIQRAEDEKLNWPITYLLHEVDNPDALEFFARQLAVIARRLEGKGSYSPFLLSSIDRWDRDRGRGAPMSVASKARLLSIWNVPGTDKHLREQAFRIWAASEAEGDLEILRRIDGNDALRDNALFQRLRRGDHSAIPALLKKLAGKNEGYWWQLGRNLWSDEMTQALDESLTRRGKRKARTYDRSESREDWITAENLLRLPVTIAERLLLKHWDHLRFVPIFNQAALYVATPTLRARVAETMADCPDPKEIVKYIDSHYNIKFQGGSGVTRLEQVESLIPYFHLFSGLAIDSFWRVCNEQGWLEFRRKYLDSLLTNRRDAEVLGGEHTFKALDEFLQKNRLHWIDTWLDRYVETGTSIEQIMKEIAWWLLSKASIEALRVAAAAVVHIGRRVDLKHLRVVLIEPQENAQEIVADATFAVMRRTLR